MTWRVRRATLKDLPGLRALCKASVGPEDYAIAYLEPTIRREILHVALDARGRIVGMGSYRSCLDGSAWLGMARTHPDRRRQGVAAAVVASFVDLARTSGASHLRLWSDATNLEGTGLAAAAGFREVAQFSRVVGPAARGALKGTPRRFDEALWSLVRDSPVVARGKGYASHDGVFLPVTRPVVSILATQGAFIAWGGNLISLTDPDPRMPLEFTLWAGNLAELFAEGCRRAAAAGRAEAATFVPHDREFVSEARRAGLREDDWGREAVLFEMAVPPKDPEWGPGGAAAGSALISRQRGRPRQSARGSARGPHAPRTEGGVGPERTFMPRSGTIRGR